MAFKLKRTRKSYVLAYPGASKNTYKNKYSSKNWSNKRKSNFSPF